MGDIGVITEEQSKEERVEAFRKAASRLEEEIDGLEDVMVDDWNRNADKATVFATVENDGVRLRSREYNGSGKTYELNANLRSVSPRIKNVLENLVNEGVITTYRIVRKPEKQYEERGTRVHPDKTPVGYDTTMYELDLGTY